jgi:hypothetical protein
MSGCPSSLHCNTWWIRADASHPAVDTYRRWGGWGSNPRPADYEKYGLLHHAR